MLGGWLVSAEFERMPVSNCFHLPAKYAITYLSIKVKMTKTSILLVLLAVIFYSNGVVAQSTVTATAAKNTTFGLHLMPLSLSNVRSRYRLGLTARHKRMRYMLDFSYGDGSTPNWLFNNEGILFRGIRPEVSYHIPTKSTGKGPENSIYFGLELPYTRLERILYHRSYTYDDGKRYRFDRARKIRTRTTAMAKFGFLLHVGTHLYLDLYGGLGGGRRQVAYEEVVNKREDDGFYFDNITWAFETDRQGSGWVIDLALGYRVGCNF